MDYSRIASTYEWLERATFGKKLQCARTAHLDRLESQLPEAAHVLIIGDGDGRFLAALLDRFPTLTIYYVEPSAAMIALAKKRVPCDARVLWMNQTIQEWCATTPCRPASKHYHLVASHFVFDSLNPDELASILQSIRPQMTRDGHWILTDFDASTSRWAACLVTMMYGFLHLVAGVS